MVTGEQSGVVVIDVDPGGDATALNLPATMTVVTGRGGKHFWLKHPGVHVANIQCSPANPVGKLGAHVDLRADGGYVVLPYSQNEVGPYRLRGTRRGMAPMPQTVLSRLQSPLNGTSVDHASDAVVEAGGRHGALLKLAATMRYAGATEPELLTALRTFNEARCDPPKPDDEVARMAQDYSVKSTRVDVLKAELRAREQARIEIARERSDAAPFSPPDGTAADYLAEDDEDIAYTIEEWHPTGGNTLVVARGKAGKTSLGVNLMRSLADGVPFLGRYGIEFSEGTIAYFDYEMNSPMFKFWLRKVGVKNLDRLVRPWHLRGLPNPLLHEERVAEWLAKRDVKFWIVDAAMGAWSGYVTNENSNSEVDAFTKVLDQIKTAAGVEDLVLCHHMGAAQFAEGGERGRGATRLEDWADHIWYLTRDDQTGARAMWAKGRGVDVPADQAIDIQYSAESHRLMAGATRAARRQDAAAYAALAALDAYPEKNPKTGEWTSTIRPAEYKGQYRAAIDEGWIEQYTDGRAKRCKITKEGRQALKRRVSSGV
jgi:hypothetical protein